MKSKELKKRIAELERELRKKGPSGIPEAEVQKMRLEAGAQGYREGYQGGLEAAFVHIRAAIEQKRDEVLGTLAGSFFALR